MGQEFEVKTDKTKGVRQGQNAWTYSDRSVTSADLNVAMRGLLEALDFSDEPYHGRIVELARD